MRENALEKQHMPQKLSHHQNPSITLTTNNREPQTNIKQGLKQYDIQKHAGTTAREQEQLLLSCQCRHSSELQEIIEKV